MGFVRPAKPAEGAVPDEADPTCPCTIGLPDGHATVFVPYPSVGTSDCPCQHRTPFTACNFTDDTQPPSQFTPLLVQPMQSSLVVHFAWRVGLVTCSEAVH